MNMNDMMRNAMTGKGDYALDAAKAVPENVTTDKVKTPTKKEAKQAQVLDGAELFYSKKTALAACNSVNSWTIEDELDDGESYSDRLYAMLIGVVDEDKNGTMTDEEQAVFDMACDAVQGYLVDALGVDEEDAQALTEDWDDEAGERVREFIKDGFESDELSELAHDYALSDDDETMDAAGSSAVYKLFKVVRGGNLKTARKRISGKVSLSAGQKASIKKAQRLSHDAHANLGRKFSMSKRKKLGIKNGAIG